MLCTAKDFLFKPLFTAPCAVNWLWVCAVGEVVVRLLRMRIIVWSGIVYVRGIPVNAPPSFSPSCLLPLPPSLPPSLPSSLFFTLFLHFPLFSPFLPFPLFLAILFSVPPSFVFPHPPSLSIPAFLCLYFSDSPSLSPILLLLPSFLPSLHSRTCNYSWVVHLSVVTFCVLNLFTMCIMLSFCCLFCFVAFLWSISFCHHETAPFSATTSQSLATLSIIVINRWANSLFHVSCKVMLKQA